MRKSLKQHLTRSRNSSSIQQNREDPLSNALTGDVAAGASIGSQDLPSSRYTVPVVNIVGPGVPTSGLSVRSSLLPRKSLAPKSETRLLLGDQIDLWDEAYNKLGREQPELFERYKRCIVTSDDETATSPSLNLEDVDSENRERYLANLIEKRLQNIQNQEWSAADDIYKKIVKTVLFAKDFVGQAVSTEPHAALAWAGVSMLLPLLLKPDSQRQAAIEGLAVVSDLMLEYRVIEKTFWSRSRQLQAQACPADVDLIINAQSKIVGLYSQILEFQIRMVYYYSCRGWNRYFRDVVTSDDWRGMQTAIEVSCKAIGEQVGTIGNVHLDNALEAQKTQFQQFSEQTMPILKSLHSTVARIENFVNDTRKAKGCHSFSFGVCLGQAPQIAPDAFIGRTDELQQLQDWLLPEYHPDHQSIVSIVGMGGLGKTQSSLAYVRNCSRAYSSIFWVNAKDEPSLTQSMAQLSAVVLPESAATAAQNADNEKVKVDLVRRWLSEPENDQWLLIFDNYDDPCLLGIRSPTGYDIRSFFPIRSQGSIIITSRSTKLNFSKQLKLQKLEDVNTSVAILSQRSERDLSHDGDASDLARRLDGLPLALATAGAYLGRTGISCGEYLGLYNSAWKDLIGADTEELFEYAARTMSSTWTISLDQVRNQDGDAAELLTFLAYLNNWDIWYDLIKAGAHEDVPWMCRVVESKIRFQRAMSKLQDYNLVNVVAGSYQIHPCLHDWLVEGLNSPLSYQYFITALTCVGSSIDDKSSPHYWVTSRKLLEHVEHLESPRFHELWERYAFKEEVLDVIHRVAQLLQDWDRLTKAEQMYDRALAGYEKALGPDHTSTLNTIHALGDLYYVQGKLDAAEQMYDQALVGYEKVLGPDHTSTLRTVHNLGILYCNQGKLDAAEQIFDRALAGYEKALGPDHTSTLNTVNNLGNLYRVQGKLDAAKQMYDRALAGYKKALGPDHTSTLNTVHALGNLYRVQGKLDAAKQMYDRALVGYEKVLGPDHTSTLRTVHNLGNLYCDQGKLDAAEQMYDRALAGYEKALGPDHTSTLNTVHALGNLYRVQGKLDAAKQMYDRALAGYKKALGPDHTSTLNTVHALGNLYRVQGKLDAAKQMYDRALAGYEKALGPDHTSTLNTIHALGNLYYDQGKLDAAEQMYDRALVGYEKALGPDHTSTLDTVHTLSLLYRDQGKLDAAEQILTRSSQV